MSGYIDGMSDTTPEHEPEEASHDQDSEPPTPDGEEPDTGSTDEPGSHPDPPPGGEPTG